SSVDARVIQFGIEIPVSERVAVVRSHLDRDTGRVTGRRRRGLREEGAIHIEHQVGAIKNDNIVVPGADGRGVTGSGARPRRGTRADNSRNPAAAPVYTVTVAGRGAVKLGNDVGILPRAWQRLEIDPRGDRKR